MQKLKVFSIWMILVLVALFVFQYFAEPQQGPRELNFSEFIQEVEHGRIASVNMIGNGELEGEFKDKSLYTAYAPVYDDLVSILRENHVTISAAPKRDNLYWSIFISWLPILVIVGLFFFLMKQMQGGANKALSFGKSRARLVPNDRDRVTFSEVAGCDEAKDDLLEIVAYLTDPKKFQRLGGKIPKGVLLIGPPGTGKTLLAKAVAGEANVPFFSISGSDFVEMFVGVGASRVRDLFEKGKKNAPCLIFIDELDAVGRLRGAGLGGGHDEREQTLNQLLVEMDGFETNHGVILLAATNRPDVLDPALLRPGRFDRKVVVDLPDFRGRRAILDVHIEKNKVPLDNDVDMDRIARGTPGFTGADLANLINEAALLAAREDKKSVAMSDFETAKDRVLMGAERRSRVINDKEKRNTAFHEAGHTLVACFAEHADPLHKVTIIPRGMALGITQQLPIDDRYTYSRDYLNDRLAVAMGGRAAEEIALGQITSGAKNDLEQATKIAHSMVCELGMSDVLGPISLGKSDEAVFLGRDYSKIADYSEATARQIDDEIRNLVTEAYTRARKIILEHRTALDALTHALLDRETLSGEEVNLIIEGKELPPLPEVKETPSVEVDSPVETETAETSEVRPPAPLIPAPKAE